MIAPARHTDRIGSASSAWRGPAVRLAHPGGRGRLRAAGEKITTRGIFPRLRLEPDCLIVHTLLTLLVFISNSISAAGESTTRLIFSAT